MTLLLLLACCLAGCATDYAPPQDVTAGDNSGPAPDPVRELTPAQVVQLKSRLDLLKVGMSRAKTLEILDLDSFHVHPFGFANASGNTYHFKGGHMLELGMEAGNYDSTLRWAKFDGELWPKPYKPLKPAPPVQ